ncbi:hypothetical protein ABZP36_027050 [Zizania latifolia]
MQEHTTADRAATSATPSSPIDGNKLVLEGHHNFDARWVSELQSNGSLVLPRVVLEAFPGVVLLKKKLRDKAIDLIVSECRDKGYDGVVLESWSRWAVYGVLDDPKLRNMNSLKTLLAAKGSVSHGHSHMIFLGINFYGNDFLLSKGNGGNAITGRDFIYLLEKYNPSLQWDEKSSEHFFIYSDEGLRHAVF